MADPTNEPLDLEEGKDLDAIDRPLGDGASTNPQDPNTLSVIHKGGDEGYQGEPTGGEPIPTDGIDDLQIENIDSQNAPDQLDGINPLTNQGGQQGGGNTGNSDNTAGETTGQSPDQEPEETPPAPDEPGDSRLGRTTVGDFETFGGAVDDGLGENGERTLEQQLEASEEGAEDGNGDTDETVEAGDDPADQDTGDDAAPEVAAVVTEPETPVEPAPEPTPDPTPEPEEAPLVEEPIVDEDPAPIVEDEDPEPTVEDEVVEPAAPAPEPDPEPDAPRVSAPNVSGDEDSSIPLSVNMAESSDPAVSISSVTFSGVPEGATLSAGVDNEDGSWTVSAAQLVGLTITPPENSNENFSITAAVTTANSTTGANTVVNASVQVSVTGVADAPVIELGEAQGNEDTAIDLPINITLPDNDGSETLFITISNVPEGALLSAGTNNEDGTWTISPGDIAGLTITPPEHFSGTLNLEVEAVSQEDDGDVAETSIILPVVVGAVADAPEVDAQSNSGNEDEFIPLEIEAELVDTDGSESLSFTISDIPEGATLTNDLGETFEGFDTLELAPEQIVGLQIRGPEHFSGEIALTVTVTSTETTGETAETVQSVVIEVVPVVDTPELSVQAAEGQEDEFIALDITTAFADQDGSEYSYITISGIPDGAVLKNTAGDTFSGDNSFDLTPDQLIGLSIKAPEHSSDDFELEIEAVSEEDNGDTDSVSATLLVQVHAVADAPDLIVGAEAIGQVQDSTESQQTASDGDDELSGDGGDNVIGGGAGNDVIYGDQQNFVSVVSLDISAALVDSDESETLTVSLEGVPSGATLSLGTLQDDGRWELSQDDLDTIAGDGLSLTLTGDVADFEIGVIATATDHDPETGVETQSSKTATVNVTLDRDASFGDDVLTGGDGDDELHGMGGNDRLEGGEGSDVLYGEDGDDILIGDEGTGSGPSDVVEHGWSHSNPFPDLTERRAVDPEDVNGLDPRSDFTLEADHQVTLTFLNEGAGYKNSLGYYKIGPDGEITDVQMAFNNASKQGSGGSLISNESSVTLDLEAGETFALFIVADGYSKNNFNNFENGHFEFRDGDAGATVNSTNPNLVWVAGDGGVTNVQGSVFHTAGTDSSIPLNYDGQQHVVSGYDSETGGMIIGFEDLNNGGDRDYNDLTVRVDIDPVANDFSGNSDTLFGGAGNDQLYGNQGDDKLYGGAGNDILDGGAGSDIVDGGEGDDSGIFTLGEASGTDVYKGGAGQDDLTVRVSAEDLRNPDVVADLQALRAAIESGNTEPQTFTNLNLTVESWEDISIVDMDGNPVDIDVEGASINVLAAEGSEDTSIPLDIGIGLRDADGSEQITDIVISGVPSGATLSAGTRNSDGTWTLDVAEVDGLTITPAENSADDFELSISVTVEETTTGETLTTVESLPVSVTGVADGVQGGRAATDGESSITIQVSGDHYLGSPNAQIIIDGENMGTFTVTADRAQGESQQITLTGDFGPDGPGSVEVLFTNDAYKAGVGDRNLIVEFVEVNGTRYEAGGPGVVYDKNSGADIAGQEVMPWAGKLIFNTEGNGGPGVPSGVEDTFIALNQSIVLDDNDGSEIIVGIEISGLPEGAVLSHGENIGGGTWRVDPDDFANVKVKPPENSDGDLSLTVRVTTEEQDGGDQNTSSFGVSVAVAAVADAPNLTVSASEGTAGESIALNIGASLVDTDGSESLAITVSGLPEGAQLSAGTANSNGSWTLTSQDLQGLSVTVPDGFEGSLNLSVKARSSEATGDQATTSADIAVTVLPPEVDDTEGQEGGDIGGAADSTITIQVSGDHYLGAPKAQITIDGQDMGTFTITADREQGETQQITLTGNFGADGPQSVEVRFTNDAYKAGVDDRNLIVDYIEVNGTRYEAEGPGVVYDKNSGADIPGQEVMPWAGALIFDTADNGGPGGSEDEESASSLIEEEDEDEEESEDKESLEGGEEEADEESDDEEDGSDEDGDEETDEESDDDEDGSDEDGDEDTDEESEHEDDSDEDGDEESEDEDDEDTGDDLGGRGDEGSINRGATRIGRVSNDEGDAQDDSQSEDESLSEEETSGEDEANDEDGQASDEPTLDESDSEDSDEDEEGVDDSGPTESDVADTDDADDGDDSDEDDASDPVVDEDDEEDTSTGGASEGQSGESEGEPEDEDQDEGQDRTVFDLITSEDDGSDSNSDENPDSLDEDETTDVDAEESSDWMDAIEDQDESEDDGADLFEEGGADAPLIDDTPDSPYDDNSGSVI